MKNQFNAITRIILFSAVIYYVLVIALKLLLFNEIPGYGGDQVQLYNDFKNSIYREYTSIGIGVFDRLMKFAASYLNDPKAAVLAVFIIPFLINLVASFYSAVIILRIYNINAELKYLLVILFWLHPLAVSLQLSGHTTFMPALSLMLALITAKSWLYSLVVSIMLFFINPYICFGFMLIAVGSDFFSNNKERYLFYSFIGLLVFLKIVINFPLNILEIGAVNLDLSNRRIGAGSGIYPINWFLPDINSIAGIATANLKNEVFTYLNVPESNYSILLISILSTLTLGNSFCKRSRVAAVVGFVAANLIFTFPPHTAKLEGIFFPSYILNSIVPELRIISRFSVFIDYLVIIYFVMNADINKIRARIWSVLTVLLMLLPLNFPFINISSMGLTPCDPLKSIEIKKDDYWAQYYSDYFGGARINVAPTLDNEHRISYCKLG